MATDPEALAQIARLLDDVSLRSASMASVRLSADAHFERLVEGLVAEATASDDVFDRDSALSFLNDRLRFFGALLSDEQRSRLSDALRAKIEAW